MPLPTHSLRRFPLFILLAVLGLTLLAACDDGGEDPADDTSTPDTASDVADSVDTAEPDTDEPDTEPDVMEPMVDPAIYAPLRIALVYRDLTMNDAADMFLIDDPESLLDARKSDLAKLTTGIDCRAGNCLVTRDLGWFVYQTGSGELQVAEIGDDLQVVAADLQTLDTGIANFTLAGTRLAWVNGNTARFEDLADGLHQPTDLGEIVTDVGDDVTYSGGGVSVAANGEHALIFRYDLSSLAVFRVGLDGQNETFLYRYGIPRGSGSYYTGNNPMVVTEDGNTAIVLIDGNFLYNSCTSNQGCQDLAGGNCEYFTNLLGQQSSSGLCGATQRTLQRIALDDSDLSQSCETDADCDARHRCLVDPTTLLDTTPKSVCAPRQLVLGPRTADSCADTEPGQYADVLKKLRKTPDDRVVFLGINDCDQINVPNNAIVAVDATLSSASIETLEGPYDHDHGAGFCYDATEDRWDFPNCTIEIQDFDLGPDGGLVIQGSGRDSGEADGRELWFYDEDGSRYPVTSDIFNDVTRFFAVTR